MKSLWWEGKLNKLSYLTDTPEPEVAKPNDIKIKVAFSGVCGTDFHYMSGEMGKLAPKDDGVILGHEFSGTVTDVGSEVTSIKIGDRVCVDPQMCCGTCNWKAENKPHFCRESHILGVKQNGGWAEYCVAPLEHVYKLPQGVSLGDGALSEPYSCVLRGWRRMGELPLKSSKVLIQGAGIIGSMFACLFYIHGYKNVTICEPHEGRRKTCSELGLGFDVIHPKELDLLMSGKDADEQGFDVIFDCTGNCKAVEKTITLSRRGAFIAVFGCCPAGEKIQIEPFQLFWKELKIAGSLMNPFCFGDAVQLLEDLKPKGLLDYDKIGVEVFDPCDYEKAFKAVKSGVAAKAMFKF